MMPQKKLAVILAGGMGTRLKPYTAVLPKPLVPIGNYTILEIVIKQLAQQGFTHITMAVNHQAELIKAFFGNGERWNLQINYSLEKIPLSTMGPLKIIDELPENFLVMNGDILTDLNMGEFLDKHIASQKIFTIACSHRKSKIDYGVLQMDAGGSLAGFVEKPSYEFDVSMGIYGVSRRVLQYIPENIAFGFDQLMLTLIKEKKDLPKVFQYNGYWLDIGRPEDYEKALEEFEAKRNELLKS